MPTSQYFNHNDSNTPETNLLDDLVIESIKIYGVDCYYLRRDITAENDQWYGEDTNPTFTYARLLEMYVKNVDGFEGQGDFVSKFGLEMADEITFSISQRRFGEMFPHMSRPYEGDLIYYPPANELFTILFVNDETMFYPLGSLPLYDIRCTTTIFDNIQINTGIPVLDAITTNQPTEVANVAHVTTLSDNQVIEAEANTIIVPWGSDDPFGGY